MSRTSVIRNLVYLAALAAAPVGAAPSDTLPPGAVCRLGMVRQFGSVRSGLVAFSADGTRLVAGAAEQTIHVWDWPIVKAPRTLLHPTEHLATCVVLAPDGKTLLLGTNSGVVLRREVGTGAVLHSTNAAKFAIRQIACARDSRRFVTYESYSVLRLWDGGPSPVWEVAMSEEPQCLALAGDRVFAGCQDGTVRSWSLATGKPLAPLQTGRAVRNLGLTADGRTVFTEASDHRLLAWDVASARVVQTFDGHTGAVCVIACSADGKRLASAGLHGGVRLWDVATGEELNRLYSDHRTAMALAFAPDGRALVAATPDSFIDRWDLETFEAVSLLTGHREEVEAIAYAEKGRELLTWSAAECLRWHAESGKLLGTARDEKPARAKLVTSPNGKYRVTVDTELSLFPMLVSVETGKEIELAGSLRSIRAAAFSRDDKILAAAGSDGNVTLWETFSGEVLVEFKAHEGRVNAIAFAPDGETFATGGGDASVVVWSLIGCGPPIAERWRNPAPDDLESMWKILYGDRGAEAFAVMRALMATPTKAVPFIRSKLPPPLDLRRMKQYIVQLDADDFEMREKASQELERLGRDAEQALRDALTRKPSAEVRRRIDELLNDLKGDDTPRVRCWSRAVFVLEQINTAEARTVLTLLAEGDRVAKAAEDARAALKR